MIRKVVTALSFMCLIAVSAVTTATAAAPVQTPAQGIALTPAIQNRVLGPAEKSVSFTIQLTNYNDRPVTLAINSTDFTTLNQSGGLSFLGTNSSRVINGHGLSDALVLQDKQVTVAPNASRAIIARIDDVTRLSPGGHYGALLAQVVPEGMTNTAGNKVNLNQTVSSLIFLETAGKGTKTLELLRPSISNFSVKLPDSLNLIFKATGNTQTIPRGLVTISRGGTTVSQGIINENSSLLLPDSTRLLQTQLKGNRQPLLAGLYTVSIQYRYEGSLGVTNYEKRILYVNFLALVGLVVLGCLVVYLAVKGRSYWKQKRPLIASKDFEPNSGKIEIRNRSQAAQKVVVKRRIKRRKIRRIQL